MNTRPDCSAIASWPSAMPKSITIVGGGLAGLTLGIGLRKKGIPVTVWESGCYPRHRVCGEFISGRGLRSLKRLGLLEGFQAAGSRTAQTAQFFSEKPLFPARPLPDPALCISRFAMDDFLACEFQHLGGDLHSGARWQGTFGESIVRATGRRAEPVAEGWRLFGLKIHAREVTLAADLEMHFVASGYVGLCQLPGSEVNICGLFRSATTVPDLAKTWNRWLSGAESSVLHSRIADAQFDNESFCSIAGISLTPKRAINQKECSIGDGLTMIPPVTGNGMSMAFESAEMAIEPLLSFSRGLASWAETQHEIARACDAAFTQRLRWAALIQKALFNQVASKILILIAAKSPWMWNSLFQRTR